MAIKRAILNEIKVTEPILDYPIDGTAKPVEAGGGVLTYRDVFNQALNSSAPNEIIPVEQKSKLFQITLKLFSGNEIDLTVDEASLIKGRVGKIYNSPLIYGRVCELRHVADPSGRPRGGYFSPRALSSSPTAMPSSTSVSSLPGPLTKTLPSGSRNS
jgi:hypothetical protein